MTGERRSFPRIGWNPAPGDVEQTRDLGKKLGGLATELGTALRELEQIEAGAWKGKAAVAFTEYVSEDVAPLIKKSHESFEKASGALHRWARELQGFQDEADRLEKSVGKKLDALADANAKGPSTEVGEASGAVNEVTGQVDDLEVRYKRAAGLISKDLDKATDIAPDEPNFWEKLLDDVEDTWDATAKWVEEHAGTIALIGDLLSDLTGILAVLAIVTLPFPPLSAIFGAAALITSGLALLSHSIAKAAGADVSWQSIGLDAVGLLPGIGAFGKGVKLAEGANLSAKAAEFGKGFSGVAVSGARNLVAFGEAGGNVAGGHKITALGMRVTLWGSKNIGLISHESGTMSRLAGIANKGYHQGQLIGTKGLKLISGGHAAINPLGNAGRALDAGFKIAPKLVSIPQHIGEAVNPGDRFHQAATSH
ncbi:putative T7SS-secreted protein [Streptomyces sp. H27-D2]|uniref:putative T7SS-secreted protein n=1 Tax=Streptomyces sp. H27-D2 TaxID=3046304 RepID=UPI002DB747C7|nr:enoyl-CoA hydratase/isomerase family protein [Streptomyces sp. H27-D2]MEC4016505.1 enoyl-CoA hydratase/isomerase family protein [Streptomyces sp. H27-D2]